ncbi:MAG: translation elongation factor Ts [Spirochaetaceae bacterium]|jgi:elongation factor Ts|nr:translation elongation factor Ts [Spirochaetaceae bacterium]
MEIKATDVKALRDRTGAGMMECKKALEEAGGDAAKAEKLLKEKGLAALEKRAGRITGEGRVFIVAEGGKIALCEITCETDFVAKNEEFVALGESICKAAIKKGYTSVNDELSGMLSNLATKIRENMTLKRVLVLDIPAGAAAAKYVHTSDWKTGVIVIVGADPAGAADNPLVKEFVYDCCLHIAAFTPLYNTRADVDAAYIAEQKDIFTKQTASLDKPDKVKEGIVQGKINKHLAEICFMDQTFVKDDKLTVAKKMEEVGKAAGAKLTLLKTVLVRVGE